MEREKQTKTLLGILILMFACSCTNQKNLSESKYLDYLKTIQNPLSKLMNEIKNHGTISPYPNGSPEVLRSNIDSLDKDEVIEINNFLTSLNKDYPTITEFIIVNYYPGEDDCNSTGTASRNEIGFINKNFNKEISFRTQITQLNLYKRDDGISRWNKNRNWEYDDNLIITNQFFTDHYPCSSYLILHKSGKYYYYYGESWLEKKLYDIDLFMESINRGLI